MALSSQDSDEDKQYILVAKMDSARSMTTALKAIHFKDVGFGNTKGQYLTSNVTIGSKPK